MKEYNPILDTDRSDYCPECNCETIQTPIMNLMDKSIDWTCDECGLVIDQEPDDYQNGSK